jgi:hypothetical protein
LMVFVHPRCDANKIEEKYKKIAQHVAGSLLALYPKYTIIHQRRLDFNKLARKTNSMLATYTKMKQVRTATEATATAINQDEPSLDKTGIDKLVNTSVKKNLQKQTAKVQKNESGGPSPKATAETQKGRQPAKKHIPPTETKGRGNAKGRKKDTPQLPKNQNTKQGPQQGKPGNQPKQQTESRKRANPGNQDQGGTRKRKRRARRKKNANNGAST